MAKSTAAQTKSAQSPDLVALIKIGALGVVAPQTGGPDSGPGPPTGGAEGDGLTLGEGEGLGLGDGLGLGLGDGEGDAEGVGDGQQGGQHPPQSR